jgi:hypothetical protein
MRLQHHPTPAAPAKLPGQVLVERAGFEKRRCRLIAGYIVADVPALLYAGSIRQV